MFVIIYLFFRIASMQDIHDEEDDLNSHEWEIALTFTEGGLFGQEDLNGITVGIHLKDDNILKPELEDYLGFTPIHYDLSIIPDLTTPNQTISFKGTAKVNHNLRSQICFLRNFGLNIIH